MIQLRIFYDTILDSGSTGREIDIPPPTVKTAAELREVAKSYIHQLELDTQAAEELALARLIASMERQAVKAGLDRYQVYTTEFQRQRLKELGYILLECPDYKNANYVLIFWDEDKYNNYMENKIIVEKIVDIEKIKEEKPESPLILIWRGVMSYFRD